MNLRKYTGEGSVTVPSRHSRTMILGDSFLCLSIDEESSRLKIILH
jgi:hypothetical protein